VKQHFVDANALLVPYYTSMTENQKKHAVKISDESLPFVEKAKAYFVSAPQFLPGYVSPTEFDDDFGVMKSAVETLQLGTPLIENIENLRIAGGSDVMVAALAYYQSVKRASEIGVAGAKAIYDDLRKRFPGFPDEDVTPPTP